jgi:hypothetical protein
MNLLSSLGKQKEAGKVLARIKQVARGGASNQQRQKRAPRNEVDDLELIKSSRSAMPIFKKTRLIPLKELCRTSQGRSVTSKVR